MNGLANLARGSAPVARGSCWPWRRVNCGSTDKCRIWFYRAKRARLRTIYDEPSAFAMSFRPLNCQTRWS
jgi:hypothetical protein